MSYDPFGAEELTLVILQPPFPALVVRSEWERPLNAILTYLGYSIDDVVSSRRVASEVRLFWRLHAAARRQASG
jgi:hypothetical protein